MAGGARLARVRRQAVRAPADRRTDRTARGADGGAAGRQGGDPDDAGPARWGSARLVRLGKDLASRGYGVIITCADASARLLGVPAAQLGSVDQPEPAQGRPGRSGGTRMSQIEEDQGQM